MNAETKLDKLLEEYYPQMEADFCRLLSYPSVTGEAKENAPFGEDIAAALDFVLELGTEMGFKCKNLQGYAGIIDFGNEEAFSNSEDFVGALSHIDVVPADDKWSSPPFKGTIKNGSIYGRGAADDKGPLIATLYACKAIKESGLPIKKGIRQIIGTDEECDFRCIEYYNAHEKQPALSFSPDGTFPLIHGEKGMLPLTFKQSWPKDNNISAKPYLKQIQCGQAGNIIPSEAEAVFLWDNPEGQNKLKEAHANFPLKNKIKMAEKNKQIIFTAEGKGAHGSMPEAGENALNLLLSFLKDLDFAPAGSKEFIRGLAGLIFAPGENHDLGIGLKDEFGSITAVATCLNVNESQGIMATDIRYPVKAKADDFFPALEKRAGDLNILVEYSASDMPPMYLSLEDDLVTMLLEAYREITGDNSPPLISGFGTYARMMAKCVSYGPLFPGQVSNAHQADECISQKDLLLCAKIYARALYKMANHIVP